MLLRLEIKNYAIIQQLNTEFDDNLNIITGETGAGKSILIGALSLLLGERIDWALFENQTQKCFIDANFSFTPNDFWTNFFLQNELEIEGQTLILRKEINPQNKTSRNFINDNLVSLSAIKNVSAHLIDLHQQFDTLELYDSGFQFKMIDALADNFDLLQAFQQNFKQYSQFKNQLQAMQAQQLQAQKDISYYTFLLQEFEEINLKPNEIEQLEDEIKILNKSAEIQTALTSAAQMLSEDEGTCNAQLKKIVQNLKPLKEFSSIAKHFTRLESNWIDLQDIAKDISQSADKLQNNPERLQMISDRLNMAYKLLKKHNAQTTQDLQNEHQRIQTLFENIQNIEKTIAEQNIAMNKMFDKCNQQAEELYNKRKNAIEVFIKQIHFLLQKVGMPNAQFKVELQASDLNFHGCNNIEFLLDANKTNVFKPLKKVASGGELNRLMLAIKSIVAKKLALPTMIFDEIDTGVSGEVAKQIGDILHSLSQHIQIICITHQATIAAKGHKHFFVYKIENEEKILTNIKTLNPSERNISIAEMLSGTPPTEKALAIAKELLQ